MAASKAKQFAVMMRTIADFMLLMGAFLVSALVHDVMAENQTGQITPALPEFWTLSTVASILCIASFAIGGFYTKGRSYSSRYKLGMISIFTLGVFTLLGVCSHLLNAHEVFRWPFILISAFMAVLFLVLARVWSSIWRQVISAETRFVSRPPDAPIETVLVIGGGGYVGSGLLEKLLSSGYKVRLLDLFMFGTDPINEVLHHKNLEVIEGDFRHVDKVVRAMHGVDAVVHLGGIVGDPACALNEELTLEMNLYATRLIAECAKGKGISRFVFASSCSVYGASDDVLDESSSLNPVSLYARSKIGSERVLQHLKDEFFEPTILRFGTIYGLSGRTRFDLVVNLLSAKAVMEGKITVFGPDQWRPFVHVDDVSEAVYLMLRSPAKAVCGQIFNVGSDEQNCTLGDVGRLVKKVVPSAELIESDSDGDRRNYRVSFNKIRLAVGFKAQWTLEDGVKQVVKRLESGEVGDYMDSRYSNVKTLKENSGLEGFRAENEWLRSLAADSVAME
jgi:nucleoside-diphosphate-sugar epimerase